MKRLWDAYEKLGAMSHEPGDKPIDTELDAMVRKLVSEFDEHMNDDFNTAKVLASMFELVPVINSIKDKTIPITALPKETLLLLQSRFKSYLEDVFGLKSVNAADNTRLQGVMKLLIDIRKEAKSKKDFATSDKIRNQLAQLGVTLKDDKSGEMSWSFE